MTDTNGSAAGYDQIDDGNQQGDSACKRVICGVFGLVACVAGNACCGMAGAILAASGGGKCVAGSLFAAGAMSDAAGFFASKRACCPTLCQSAPSQEPNIS